jgi:hypothetical protein
VLCAGCAYDLPVPDLSHRECHCLLCAGDGTPRRLWRSSERSWPARERLNARLVREYGWGVTGVAGLTMPDWAYSIGLWHSFGSAEVCLLGVPQQRAMTIVNSVGELVRDGLELTPELRLSGIVGGRELALAPVHSSWYERLFGAAIDYYQRPPFPMVQLRWADEPGGQPSLWLPFDEHPPSPWTT